MGTTAMTRAMLVLLAISAVIALPVDDAGQGVLADDASVLIDADEDTNTAVALKAQLAKLEKTYERIKGSCVANNVPHELGEGAEDVKAKKAPKTVAELQSAIKAKEKVIDKITDACMPGES